MVESDEDITIISKRKLEGIKIPLENNVQARGKTTYLEHVDFIHNALPEVDYKDINTSITFLNHKFSAPILIDAMTGGTPEATKINANLGSAAEELQLGMVVGSQRAALVNKSMAETYTIARKKAPNAFIAANIGGAQLSKGLRIKDIEKLVEMIQADALVIHLNPLQELIQPEGEPRYKNVLGKIREIVTEIKIPIIVKEVGSGISKDVALKLEHAGISSINVAGLGGTSWAGIEQHRASMLGNKRKVELGKLFWNWGIPTAASIMDVKRTVQIPIIASGGIRNGLEVAKCISIGATLCGIAYPLLKAATISKEMVMDVITNTIEQLKSTMFLVGASNCSNIPHVRKVISNELLDWITKT